MNRFKKSLMLLLAVGVTLSISACSDNGTTEFESAQSFEFYFYPEEYEEEYSEVSKTLSLDGDTEYQLKIEAECQDGTMEISVVYGDESDKCYAVNADAPCSEIISIPQNSADEVKVVTSIEPDTKGAVICDLLYQTE